MTRKYRWK